MSPISRGFHGRRRQAPAGRVPPGQYVTEDFPVLSAGPTPHTALANWGFSISGGGASKNWTWDEFRALPTEDVTVDIHCVTRWSKLDTHWLGVSVDTLLDQVEHDAEYVLPFCDGGYTTNLPIADVTGGQAWVAFGYDGEPLDPEHGGPARLLVPHLYFWKSAKWVRGLEPRDDDEPGFWEGYGYHNHGDHGESSATRATERVAGADHLAAGNGHRPARGDLARQVNHARCAGVAGAYRRAARRRTADRRGRVPDRALVLHRVAARGRRGDADGRANRGR